MEDILPLRYADQPGIMKEYDIFPTPEEWRGKILFIETCEERPDPVRMRKELDALDQAKVFENVSGIIVGKPQDEAYYEEYKEILLEVTEPYNLPILYNLPFGHAFPRNIIPYEAEAEVDFDKKTFTILEEMVN